MCLWKGGDEFFWKEGKGSSEPLRDDRGFRLQRVLTMPSALFEAAPTSELKCCAAAFVFKGVGWNFGNNFVVLPTVRCHKQDSKKTWKECPKHLKSSLVNLFYLPGSRKTVNHSCTLIFLGGKSNQNSYTLKCFRGASRQREALFHLLCWSPLAVTVARHEIDAFSNICSLVLW